MRAFLAVDLPVPEELRRRLGRLPEHFHATLRFFDDLPETAEGAIASAMDAAAGGGASFDLELRGVGAFPSERAPGVVWVGFGTGRENLESLAAGLAAALADRGIAPDPRGFTPHATVQRVRTASDAAAARALLESARSVSFGVAPVREIVLYESRLGPAGAVHRRRAGAALGPR